MALKDLAQRSGFTHAVDNVVFLQLELPSSQPELRELFSCQLAIDDGRTDDGWTNEWKVQNPASLYQQLLHKVGNEKGVVGTVYVPEMAARNYSTNSLQIRPLSLFGRESLLEHIGNYGYSINARVRCLSVERHQGRIWLVRGEILSGGLIFGDQRVLENVDRLRVWPNGNLQGIFFTGSELQIEVGLTSRFDHGGQLFGTQPNERNKVRIPPFSNKPSPPLLFRARVGSQSDSPWGKWHTIERLNNGLIELGDPYSSDETKPKTGWSYQIYHGEPVRRFRLLGVTRDSETGAVQRAVWEQTSATAALSQLPSEPPKLPIQPPEEVTAKLLGEVQRLCSGNSQVQIAAGMSGKQSASRPIVVVDDMDGTPTRRELLRVDWKVTINLGKGSVDWRPRTLKITTRQEQSRTIKTYELLDSDAVDSELRGDSGNSVPDAKVTFTWNLPNGPLTPTIPQTRLIGTAQDADRRPTEETQDRSRELWFQASCASGPYASLPNGWANITAQQPPAIPVGDGARATRLDAPIQYAPVPGWLMQAVPADPESGRATERPGVRLTLTSKTSPNEKVAKLELFAADVTLDSPPFRIYDKPINDPKSVPNERRPQDGASPTSLRFIHRPEWERVPPEIDNTVVCKHDTNKFVLSRAPQAVRLYLPAERALIDPVSATRGNLVGRQIVAFPLLLLPTDNSKFLKVVSAQPSVSSEGKAIFTLALELTDEEFPDDDRDKLRGFFAQLEPKESGVVTSVSRILKLERDGTDKKKATLVVVTDQAISLAEYRLTVGPTRLAIPRDVNHGLISIGVREFQISVSNSTASTANLSFASDSIRGEEGQSVLALHPWSEWGPSPNGRPWLTTGRVRLHHRNLIQEHAEFESSFEDRFPPEGPAKNPDGSTPSPLLPLADFVRAVRDRFTEATGNVNPSTATERAKEIRNWLEICTFTGDITDRPKVAMTLDPANLAVLPEAKIPSPPFDQQSLKLRKATEPGAHQHWLDASVRPEALAVGSPPTIRLTKTDPTDVSSRRAVDSSVPLLFSRHDIGALATIGLDDARCIAIVGSPEQPAKSYLFAPNGSIAQSHNFPGNALVDVALLRHSGTIRGLAIRKTNSAVELIRFTTDQATGVPTVDPAAITLTGTPMSLACTPVDSSASVFVLTSQPAKVYVVNAEDGTHSEIASAGANATAIGIDRVGDVHYLAVGTSGGNISLWHNPSQTWVKNSEGKQRDKESTLLGKASQKVSEVAEEKKLAARSIRGLCVLGNASQPIVVAVDGTRFPCVWGADKPIPTLPTKAEAQVWLQPSDALSVSFGRVQDLEQRPRFKITDQVITKLSLSGVPAEAIHSLQPIKDKEFPSGTEFNHKLRELLEAAHEVHLQTIREHSLVDSTVPLFTLGLRSGTVRVSAAIGRPEGLTDIRQFDTAETPITRLTLVGSDNTTKPVVCFAGTSAGGLLAWDARRGIEWTQVESVTAKTYLDALGVIRAVPAPPATGELTVDELSLGLVTYRSITTRGLDLIVDDAENLTDIRLWADSFKVKVDGTVEPKQFQDGFFDPGHIAFFSKIVAEEKLTSLAALNHVPRLNGIPFFVTGVRKLVLNADRTHVESAELVGVLINPDEVAAGQDPADAGTLSGIVVRALSRCKPVVVIIETGVWSIGSDNRIDWTFAVNRQIPVGDSKNFPGKIARIVGTVSKTQDGRLGIEVDAAESQALVFGRLWPFNESVTIQSHASFKRSNVNDRWLQTHFSFESERDGAKSLAIMSDEDKRLSPVASLGIDFGNVLIGGASLSGRLVVERRDGDLQVARRVQFYLGAEVAIAQFEQGGYRCLLLPSQKDKTDDVTRGQGALILWTAGDLGHSESDDVVGPLRLCAAYVKLELASDATEQAGWKIAAGASAEPVSCRVHSSLLTVLVNDDGTSKLVSQYGTVLIETTLHGQHKAAFLLEGNVQTPTKELTGLLLLEEVGKVVQATVRTKLDLSAKTVVLTDDVFWASFVKPEATSPEPEVLMPTPSGGISSTQFSVNSYTVEPLPPHGFVRLVLKKVDNKLQMGMRPVDDSQIPLLPELEPSLVQAPERIGSNEVRLSHRLRSGLALRPNAPLTRFNVALNTPTSGEPSLPTIPPEHGLLLETVVSTSGPLVRLRPEGWLVSKDVSKDKAKDKDKDASPEKYRTDGLFVLNVDFRGTDVSAVSAIEARTRKVETSEPTTDERNRYRELLRAAGVQGVAITYRLTDGQEADLDFVDSPFYDHAGEVDSALTFSALEISNGFALMATPLAAVREAQPSWIYGLDPRFRLPSTLAQPLLAPMTGRYLVNDLPTDPYADVCCLAHRQYRLERRRPTEASAIVAAVGLASESPLTATAILSTLGETFSDQETPILHSAEIPAFRQPARLSYPLSGRWLRSSTVDKPFASRVFFPPRIDWELAADKPGAMFQSAVQARITNKDGETRREPFLDFALREPQFIRSAGCVTAEVKWQAETTVSSPIHGYANVNLVWTEVIGSVQVYDAETDNTKFKWLKPSATALALSRTPLQLVIDFNSEVFLVNQADAAVPAYRVESQPENAPPSVKVRPAATYLVANPDVDTVFKPQTVGEQPERTCTISNDGGVWKATFTDNLPPPVSGTTFTLTQVAHRFVQPHQKVDFELMQDTATEDGAPAAFPIKIGSEDKTGEVLCRRPLCVKIEVADPNPLNGATVTTAVEIRRIRDGGKVINLRLAQVAPGENKYLIVTPSITAEGSACRVVTTQADGYLEAAVRLPAKIAADPSKAWTPGLKLKEFNIGDLNQGGEHELIRLESTNPTANGVFGVIGADLLARPVVGNGMDSLDGKAIDFSDTEFDLEKVEGSTPIVIHLTADHEWVPGTPIIVRGVSDTPQANGTWVVKRVKETDKRRYALYEPTVAETGAEIPAVASAVIPLREAFPPPDLESRMRSLNRDLFKWKSTDRPLLQVHWAGAGQFKSEDGKGIAWRPGGVMVGLYEQIKQVKFLANSQLSPKLAFVMTAKDKLWQRTVLFGDAAPPFQAKPKIEEVVLDGKKLTYFRLEVPDNRESLSVALPVSGTYLLDVIKSLPSGVVVYDRTER